MARSDYRCCDVCNGKVFYDANLNYEPTREPPHYYKLDYLGDWAVICEDCAKTHKCVVVPRASETVNADSADVMHDNNTNVIVQANLASTLTSHPSLSPTHCCVDCGALWRQCDDFSMNLRSASCCDACNNAPVGPQIRPLYVAPTTADQPS